MPKPTQLPLQDYAGTASPEGEPAEFAVRSLDLFPGVVGQTGFEPATP